MPKGVPNKKRGNFKIGRPVDLRERVTMAAKRQRAALAELMEANAAHASAMADFCRAHGEAARETLAA
jgi:hypothetical protein